MTMPSFRSWLLALPVILSASGAVAADRAVAFDQFVRTTAPACATIASAECYARLFRFADQDRDGYLDQAEVAALRDEARTWVLGHGPEMHPQDRQAAVLTLLALDYVGLDQLFASYDANGDGRLSPAELSADIRLDQRPIPVLARDPDAIDWQRLKTRLGPAADLLGSFLPPSR